MAVADIYLLRLVSQSTKVLELYLITPETQLRSSHTVIIRLSFKHRDHMIARMRPEEVPLGCRNYDPSDGGGRAKLGAKAENTNSRRFRRRRVDMITFV